MGRKKLPYKEGDWFAVPLADGSFAVGVAARVRKGGVVLGYFFGPRLRRLPIVDDVVGRDPSQAFLVAKFGDLGPMNGERLVVHHPDTWEKERWPLPPLQRTKSLIGCEFRVRYAESDILRPVAEEPASLD